MKTKKLRINCLNVQFILVILLSISQYIGNPTINLVITTLICLVVALANIEECTIMLFQLLPFFNLLNSKVGGTSFYYLVVIIYLFKYIKYKKFKLSYKKVAVLFYFSILRLLCGNMEVFVKWFLLFVILIITYDNELMINNLKKIIRIFDISLIISSLCGYIMLITGKSIYTGGYVYSKEMGNVTRFAGLIGDPVFYSQICSIAIGFTFVIMYNNKVKVSDICMVVVLFIFNILSYSKTGIILCVIALTIFITFEIVKNAMTRKKEIISIVLLIFSVIFFFLGMNYIENSSNKVIRSYAIRFESKDLLTGRDEISKHYIKLLQNEPRSVFIGISDKEYATPFYISSGLPFNRSHNIYIETVAVFGLLTTILIIWFIMYLIIKVIKSKNESNINILPLILLLLSGMTLHGHYEFHYYILVSICFALLFYDKKTERKEKNEKF